MNWWLWSILSLLVLGVWGFLAKLALQQVKWQMMLLFASLTYVVLYAILAIGLFVIYRSSLQFSSPGIGGRILLVALATTAGVGGVVPFYMALSQGPAALVVPLTASYSVITVLLALFVLGEALRPTQYVAVVLFIAAVILASR